MHAYSELVDIDEPAKPESRQTRNCVEYIQSERRCTYALIV